MEMLIRHQLDTDIEDGIYFLMRFISMMLIAFGMMHLWLLITCRRIAIMENHSLTQSTIFHGVVFCLLVGDCLHVVSVFLFKGALHSNMLVQVMVTAVCRFEILLLGCVWIASLPLISNNM